MGAVIELKNVTYHYPLSKTPAIKNVNLSMGEGNFYGVIGENGSGKTTLLNLIRGFAPGFYNGKLTGSVLVDGKPAADYSEGELALRMGYVFQNPLSQLSGVKETVFEEVAFGLENFGVPADEMEARVEDAMRLTDIYCLAEKNPFALSGGEQQRVALASVIVLRPDILVMDEPTSQLDPEGTERVFEIISGMKTAGKTIILAEHNADLIVEYADEVIVLSGGELVSFGPAGEILGDISLIEYGASLPRAAILGIELKKRGFNLRRVPVTESECVEMLGALIRRDA